MNTKQLIDKLAVIDNELCGLLTETSNRSAEPTPHLYAAIKSIRSARRAVIHWRNQDREREMP